MKATYPLSIVLPIVALTVQPAFAADPDQPANLNSAVYSSTAAEIFWDRSSDDGIVVAYEIRRNDTLIEMIDALSYFDSSLSPATDYVYTVIAIDDEGNRSTIASTSFQTRSSEVSATLAAPTSLSAAVYSQSAIELFWDRVSTQTLSYEIFRNGELVDTNSGTSFYDSSLTADDTYDFSVVAVSADGSRSNATSIMVATSSGVDPVVIPDDETDDADETDSGDDTDTTDETETSSDIIDIYDAIFTARSADCADYVNTYDASPVDIQNSITFDADVVVTATDTECTITSNSVPNHDFNDDTAAFAGGAEGATISATDTVSTITRTPAIADEPTPISTTLKNGIFLNGVRLDIISAGCYRPTSADAGEDGNTGFGCSTADAWLLDPLGTEAKFGADLHNAHTQPGGLYHYHGGPEAMFDDNPGSEGSPVIGFAADGFPIYGSYFYDNDTGAVRQALSGYSLKDGSRGERSDTNPGGDYDGEYVDDWEFTNAGDLDSCNGMTIDGQYGYYVTNTFPWVIRCISGTPNPTFGSAEAETTTGGPGGGPPGGA